MKKLLSILLAGAMLFGNTAGLWAASTATVTIAITITHSKDIVVGGSANGTIIPGTPTVFGAITVQNVGTGVGETIKLALDPTTPLPTGWTAYYQFAATKPAAGDAGWKTAADIAEALASNETKNLWLKLVPPAKTEEVSLAIKLAINAT